MKITFLKLFLLCTFKDPNLAEINKKFNSAEFMEFVFSKSGKGLYLTVYSSSRPNTDTVYSLVHLYTYSQRSSSEASVEILGGLLYHRYGLSHQSMIPKASKAVVNQHKSHVVQKSLQNIS